MCWHDESNLKSAASAAEMWQLSIRVQIHCCCRAGGSLFCLNNQQWANIIFAPVQSKINIAFASLKTNWSELTILICYARCMLRRRLRNVYVSRTVCLWFLTPSVCFCSLSESFFMVKGAALFLQQGSSHQGQKAHPNHKHAGENRQTRHVKGPLG